MEYLLDCWILGANCDAVGQPPKQTYRNHTVLSAASSWASLGGERTVAPGDDPLPLLGLPALPGAVDSELAPLLLLLAAVLPLLLSAVPVLFVLLPAHVGYSSWSRRLPSTMYGRCKPAVADHDDQTARRRQHSPPRGSI